MFKVSSLETANSLAVVESIDFPQTDRHLTFTITNMEASSGRFSVMAGVESVDGTFFHIPRGRAAHLQECWITGTSVAWVRVSRSIRSDTGSHSIRRIRRAFAFRCAGNIFSPRVSQPLWWKGADAVSSVSFRHAEKAQGSNVFRCGPQLKCLAGSDRER